MKKQIFIILSIIFICTSLMGADAVAFTLKAVGNVSLTRGDDTNKVENGTQLQNEDMLETKENSYAAVKFVDGSSVIKIFPRSMLTIKTTVSEDNKLNKTNYLNAGEIWAKVTRKSGEFQIDTPTTVVSVKGTRFNVKVDENGTTVNTFEGIVEMKNKKNGETGLVGAGQNGSSNGDGDMNVGEGNTEEEEGDESDPQILEIELDNGDGDTKTIKIEFE